MTPETKKRIESLVQNNKVMLFMKGTKLMPMCGFSNTVVQILNAVGVPFESVNVLDEPEIREGIKEFSNWQTIPQLYIDGNFIGGADITVELFQSGELQQLLEVAIAS
ncbi:Grx4 family monothiol glutaredoxin [Limnothrix redekei]|uniref:Glutaredoxin n=1 Tax=Limnothrix redekei LRLZ20PSL1 TaxID=3112953 RepID=A0ABW7CD25_9CYAN